MEITTGLVYSCPFCPNFKERENFDHIVSYHFNYKPYICGHTGCFARFSNEYLFNLHNRFKHDNICKCIVLGDTSLFDFLPNYLNTLGIVLSPEYISKCGQHFTTESGDSKTKDVSMSSESSAEEDSDVELVGIIKCEDANEMVLKILDQKAKLPAKICVKREDGKQQCQLCEKSVSKNSSTIRRHAVFHLNSEKAFCRLFKCLLCPGAFRMTNFRDHYRDLHNLGEFQVKNGAQYNEDDYEEIIRKVATIAFPNYQELANSSDKFESETLTKNEKCNLCGKVVCRNNIHHLVHLPGHCGVKWLFECLICSEFTSIYEISLRKHVKTIHNRNFNELHSGSHYIDKSEKYSSEIKCARSLCFPDA